MKLIKFLLILATIVPSIVNSQSNIEIQTGAEIKIDSTAEVCADTRSGSGNITGSGSFCGTSPVLVLDVIIQGLYRQTSNIMFPDTIRVYIRNSNAPYAVVDSGKGLLNSNGRDTLYFSNVSNGVNYYIQIKHRNSIETWSMSGQVFVAGWLNYNFTIAASQAYGNNMIHIDSSPLRFAIYSGDVDQDGTVDNTDASIIDNDIFNYAYGYLRTDLNGDGIADVSDLAICDNNSFNTVTAVTP